MKKIVQAACMTLLLVFGTTQTAYAKVRLPITLIYESTGRDYTVEATFMTGMELERATRDWGRWDGLGNYAIIFWDQGQVTIIKLNELIIGGLEMRYENLRLYTMGFPLTGSDQRDHRWRICLSAHCL